ncbi:MAG: IS66 family transposase [Planctomycetes bacterium]|nr:IS66 family transposase [Planctomycetota bacterium]
MSAQSELASSRLTIRQLEAALKSARSANENLREQLFGKKSERVVPGQPPALPFDLEEPQPPTPPHVDEAPDDETEHVEAKARKKRTKRGVRRISEAILAARSRSSFLPSSAAARRCQEALVEIGTERTEILDYEPASFRVQVLLRKKYACPRFEEHGVTTPDLPKRPIPKGMVSPRVIAQVAVAKYRDHLPLERQVRIYLGHGVDIAPTTMGDWLASGAELLAPIVTAHLAHLLESSIVFSDDTSITVIGPNEKKTQTRRAYLWVYLDPEGNTYLHFTEGRGRAGPLKILCTYHGTLLTDAYSGYEPVLSLGLMRSAGCWAHARRRYFKAMEEAPDYAPIAIEIIRRLYAVEREANDAALSSEDRLRLRQQKSKPLLDSFRKWLDELRGCVLPKSALGEAISYTVNQWTRLTRFLSDAEVPLDNNAAERAMRQVAVGRKNWMFAGSAAGAERAALYYSLIVSCRNLGIDAYEYLSDVLQRMAEDPSRAAELTPRAWKAARAASARRD